MKRRFFAAIILLWILFALLALGSRENSLTSDEPAHIAVGYSILARGSSAFWLIPRYGHPPLLNVLEGALLYLVNPDIPLEQLRDWGSGTISYFAAFEEYLKPVERTEVIARTPIMLLTLILGALIFRWGKELWGSGAGLLALAVLVFDPLLIAHGRLATTDAGAVLFGTATLYLLWRWMERSCWFLVPGIGGLLGLTMLSKVSGLSWTATVGLLVLVNLFRQKHKGVISAQGACMGWIGFLVLWAGHAFSWGPVQGLPISLPAPAYWNALAYQTAAAQGHQAFALGRLKGGHWWWYFLWAFMIKNPVPLLIGLIMGLVILLRRPFCSSRAWVLTVFPALYAGLAFWQGINIGYRHMLPVHPFIYLTVAGGLWQWGWEQTPLPWRRWVVGALGMWYVVGLLKTFPYEIAYFNELVGGPRKGHYYLVDSNLDWGQGYKALRRYLATHPGPKPYIGYLYNIPPELYGVEEYIPPPIPAPFHPQPGRYVISITALRYYPQQYGWFAQVKPTAEVAHSFFVYDIAPPPLEWFAQCSVPAAPLKPDVIAWGLGKRDLRLVFFDCRSAWIYPTGGERPGGYAFHHQVVPKQPLPFSFFQHPRPKDPFIARHTAGLRISLDMSVFTEQYPAFILYEQERPPRLPLLQRVAAVSANEVLPFLSPPQTTPVLMDGPLSFLGAMAYYGHQGLEVETWWQVSDSTRRPFSIMGHLMTAQGELIRVVDGLGVPPDALQKGDILVQRHRFGPVPAEASLWLRTGVYWLDTMERWAVVGSQDADSLVLEVTSPYSR